MNGKRDAAPDTRNTEILFCAFFALHFAGCIYFFRTGFTPELQLAVQWLPMVYASIGFQWVGPTALFISIAVQLAFLLNILRRVSECLIFGWPRFPSHDRDSFRHAWVRVLVYSMFDIFVVGAFGVLRSAKVADFFDMLLIALMTFIFGAITDIWDDAISATVVIIKKGKK